MSTPARIAAAAVVIAALAGVWSWWNSPERQIRRALAGLAESLSHDAPASALGAVSAAAGLQHYLAEDIVVEAGGRFQFIGGRSSVLAAAARLRAAVPALRVEFADLHVNVDDSGASASVEGTVSAVITDRAGQERTDAREVTAQMRLVDGRWVVEHARAVDVLEPVS